MTHHSLPRRLGAAFVALSLVLAGAACGDDDDDIDEPGIEENGVDTGEETDEGGESGEETDGADDSSGTDDSSEGDETG